MSAISNNSPLTPPVARPVAAAVAARPAAPAAQPALLSTAKAQGVFSASQAEATPDFKTPEEYKGYVGTRIAALAAALAAQNTAQAAATAANQAKASADAGFGKDLRALRNEVSSTTAEFQAPIDRLSAQLQEATAAFTTLRFPGRGRAAELTNQANQLQGQFVTSSRQLDGVRSEIAGLQNEIQNARQQIAVSTNTRQAADADASRLASHLDGGQMSSANAAVNDAGAQVNQAQAEVNRLQAAFDAAESAAAAPAPAAETPTPPAPTAATRPTPPGAPGATPSRPTPPGAPGATPSRPTPPGGAVANPYAKAASTPTPPAPAGAVANPYAHAASTPTPPAPSGTVASPYAPHAATGAGAPAARQQLEAAQHRLQSAQTIYSSVHQRQALLQDDQNQLNADRQRIQEANAAINGAYAVISNDESRLTQDNGAANQLEQQVASFASQRAQAEQASSEEAARTTPDNDPALMAARHRVDGLTNELHNARDTFASKLANPTARLNAAQRKYDSDMAPSAEAASRAQAQLNQENATVGRLHEECAKLPDLSVGMLTSIKWKWHGFDTGKFWKSEGKDQLAKVGVQI